MARRDTDIVLCDGNLKGLRRSNSDSLPEKQSRPLRLCGGAQNASPTPPRATAQVAARRDGWPVLLHHGADHRVPLLGDDLLRLALLLQRREQRLLVVLGGRQL